MLMIVAIGPAAGSAVFDMIAMRLSLALLIPCLSGCVGLAVAGAGAAGFGPGKTPVDHTVSWIEGKDCSSTRSRQGLSYCVEDEPPATYAGHCFKSLGDVTCYTDARPFPGRQAPVARAPGHPQPPPQDVTGASRPLAEMPSNMN